MLPRDWRTKTIADLCEFQNGNSFGPDDWDDHGLPIIRIQNLNGGQNFDYYSGTPQEKWIVNPGELLFAWAGTRGVSFGPNIWRGPTGVLNQHIFKTIPKDSVDLGWLYYVLRHITDRIEKSAHGFKATLLHVKKSDLDRQTIAFPPIEQQRAIRIILETWDQAIATTERLLANGRKHRLALLSQVLTGKRRLNSFRSHLCFRNTLHRPIPTDWSYPKFEEIATEVSQRHAGGESLPVLSCTKHSGLVDSLSYFKKQVFSKDLSTYKVVPRSAFVYATNHIEEGSIGYQDLYDSGLVSPMYTVFKTTDKVHDSYLYRLLKTEHFRQIFEAATNSSVDRRGSLRWNEFKKLHVPLPSIEEQKAINDVLAHADKEIELLKKQLRGLQMEKSALMQQLLTGKRRVRIPAQEEAATA